MRDASRPLVETSSSVDWSAFYTPLRQYVARRVHSPCDVDDLVQIILERALCRAPATQIDDVAGWLFGIARNAIADHYRARARQLERTADALASAAVPEETDEDRAMVIACMEPLLSALPAAEAQLLRRADMEGWCMQRIADELGISLTAAKSRVQRARKQLVAVTRQCCAVSMDARGRVTDLTPHTRRPLRACTSSCAQVTAGQQA
jgi:RNA polymerase sigma-70 factor (ECF subfamily)